MAMRSHLRALGSDLELSNLVDAYLLACRAEGKSPNTIRWYEQKLRMLCEYLRSRQLPLNPEAITPEIIRGLVARLEATGVSAFTTRGYVQVVKGLYTWLEDEGCIDYNPIRRVKLPKTPKYVVRPLEEDEVRHLLAAVNPRTAAGARDLAILLLLLDTGMRLGELAGIALAEGERALSDGMLKVFGKGARERMVPVGGTAQNALRRYLHLRAPGFRQALFFIPKTCQFRLLLWQVDGLEEGVRCLRRMRRVLVQV